MSLVHRCNISIELKIIALTNSFQVGVQFLDDLATDTVSNTHGYESTIRRLEDRFGGPERLIKWQLAIIQGLPQVSDDDVDSLDQFVSKVSNFQVVMMEGGVPNEVDSYMTFHHLKNLFSKDCIIKYSDYIANASIPKGVLSLLAFARRRLGRLRMVQEEAILVTNKRTKGFTLAGYG